MPPWVMNGYLTPAGLMPQPGLFRAAQSLDQRCMPGICRRQGMSIGQFEFTELKPGRHRAADKCITGRIRQLRAKPAAGGTHGLKERTRSLKTLGREAGGRTG